MEDWCGDKAQVECGASAENRAERPVLIGDKRHWWGDLARTPRC
jgi:hypothetical protein